MKNLFIKVLIPAVLVMFLLEDNLLLLHFVKKDIKGSIKSAISENPSFKQFLEENHAYGRYVKNVTNQILRNRDISGELIKCVHRIAHSNFSNREIINGTISWSSTSEGSDYWFGLYVNTKK